MTFKMVTMATFRSMLHYMKNDIALFLIVFNKPMNKKSVSVSIIHILIRIDLENISRSHDLVSMSLNRK